MSFIHNSRHSRRTVFVAALSLALSACSLSDLVSTTLPSNATDPAAVETPQGAIDRYKASIMQFRTVFAGYNSGRTFVLVSALLGDEMGSGEYNTISVNSYSTLSVIDSRNMTGNETNASFNTVHAGVWSGLSATRIVAQDGLSALARFAPSAPKDLAGHAYTLQGMAELLLAELYCSGIPLGTLLPQGGFEYGPGLSSTQVYEHAIAQFDTALGLIQDSTNFANFARVAKGRALVNLGRYAEAATAVANVPTDFKYQTYHSLTPAGAIGVSNFTNAQAGNYGTLVNKEGSTGLDYLSAGDPRVLADTSTAVNQTWPETKFILPRKLMRPNSAAPATVADGIEARLIEAEAQLKAGGSAWLTTLNALRTTCVSTVTCASPAPAGTGGVAGLPPLDDPGTANGRVDLLFRERAFWLYLTGHRLGDMRRLIRQYSRAPSSVFPVGAYRGGPDGSYGNDVNLPAPAAEIQNNPKYSGCINRDA